MTEPTALPPAFLLGNPAAAAAVIAAHDRAATPCGTCGADATAQWQRRATADEHEQHWAASEQNIRASNDGHPAVDYVADRTDTVTKAVFGCDEHVVPNPHLVHDADCGGHGNCQCEAPDA